ncbi:hypothetical protein E1301_Tti017281 [Triplophysa tibetana]|uniref:Uncharacterized protein n=1 Tax=Triplophysa tibetana TaxID=1572043 RepID=A0A5A9P8M9_9TELE|nr:hypothetical protein E1301_Tti017281 [Triplophysa tibetana]
MEYLRLNISPEDNLKYHLSQDGRPLERYVEEARNIGKADKVEKINEPDLVLCIGLFDSVPDFENILNDADVKLDALRQKIGQIPEELRGEDLHQFHRAFTPDFENILNDTDVKLDALRQKIGQIPEELRGEDLHQFHRAFTPGIQEYVEAVSFHHFIRHLNSIDKM